MTSNNNSINSLQHYDGSTHVETTRNPATLHNFGPASARDTIVYTSERPGGDPDANAKISVLVVQGTLGERENLQGLFFSLD